MIDPEQAAAAAFVPVEAAVAAGRIPGAALGVVTAAGARAVRWAGLAQRLPEPAALERETWFDLASLTKVMLTVPALLRLVEQGAADLDDPLARHLPDLFQYRPEAPIRQITLRRLLTHGSGLPAVEPIYTWGNDAETLKTLVLQRDWPLGAPCYSDIGFILLGILIERHHDRRLAELPLPEGLGTAPEPDRCAATERCRWRGRVIRGQVHDENAFALGGVAGHAGLFGTIDGVLDFAAALLSGRLLGSAATAALFRPETATRSLAWQIRHALPGGAEPPWTGGSLCSPATIGHTGFTGTGLWLDAERGHAWALLTNRVHPSRHAETGIQDLRRAVGNRVAAAWAG